MNIYLPTGDQELIALLQKCLLGDTRSQKKIYGQFYLYCTRVCSSYVKDGNDLEEVVNDGFVKIFMRLHRFDLSARDIVFAFQGWMKKIMINTAIDHLRKDKRHLSGRLPVADMVAFPYYDGAIERIYYKEIMEAITKMSPGFQLVLKLYALKGCSHREIAELLDITTGTSKSNLLRARKQLKLFLIKEKCFEFVAC